MMYQPDQNRSDSSQGMHFHVHQCVCTSPLYNPYRQPMIAPYVPPPVARPYNLAHYQYTSYNIPYNLPVFNPNAIAHQVPTATPSGLSVSENIVGERRIESRDLNDSMPLRGTDELEDYATSPNDANTEDFTKFLEQGCIIAEKIAIRNQHRPCFKNIQNLCNRTKNEILKPSHTVSNIHSQGIPWATKDFIYAYVRLINCWHMLKGYLQAKDGTLGNIDRELTADFKSCYTIWESNTKDLAEHMIRIFSNLDNNVSNPTPNQSFAGRNRLSRAIPTNILMDVTPNVDVGNTLAPQIDDVNQFSESTPEPSPREEESDGESRIYMKPGSYSVPKKTNSSDNSSPSIEFFETAKNVSAHYKKLEAKKQSDDKDWKNAITATSSLIKKNSTFEEAGRMVDEDRQSASISSNPVDIDSVRRWLYNDHYDQQNTAYSLAAMLPEKPVTVLQRKEQFKDDQRLGKSIEIALMISNEIKKRILQKFGQEPPKTHIGKMDRDVEVMKMLLEELEKTEFSQTLLAETSIAQDSLYTIQAVTHKHSRKLYKNLQAVVLDLRRITVKAQAFFSKDPEILKQICEFCNILDETLERVFPEINFNDVSPDMEDLEPSVSNSKA